MDVVRLHPVRTLTVAHDLAFRKRALVVLQELGCAGFCVPAFDRPEDAVALVVDQRADVLILDISVSQVPLAHVAKALFEAAPRVGIVAVSDRAAPPVAGVPILAKWGWATDLRDAVEAAYRNGNGLADAQGSDRVVRG